MVRKKINLHVSISPVNKFSTRILKETNSLIKLKLVDEVIISEISSDTHSARFEILGTNISIFRFTVLFASFKTKNFLSRAVAFLRILDLPFRLLSHFFKKDIAVINCHYVEALPACVILKWVKRARLIYDPHELETHKSGQNKINRFLANIFEKCFIKFADHVIVVGDSINDWYRKRYSLSEHNITTIKNVPYYEIADVVNTNLFRREFSIPADALIFLYQGLFTIGRAIPLYLNAFAQLPPDKHIIFMGFGEMGSIIKEFATKFPNIHFKEAVPSKEIKKYSSGADVGLSVIENISLSYYYSVPNKFFEYQHSNLPVIASNFPDVMIIIDKYNSGWYIKPKTSDFIEIIRSLDKTEIEKKKQNLPSSAKELSWDVEERKYLKIFSGFNW